MIWKVEETMKNPPLLRNFELRPLFLMLNMNQSPLSALNKNPFDDLGTVESSI